jgi:hypothetical protein
MNDLSLFVNDSHGVHAAAHVPHTSLSVDPVMMPLESRGRAIW